jgi:hypothetical protein
VNGIARALPYDSDTPDFWVFNAVRKQASSRFFEKKRRKKLSIPDGRRVRAG